MKPGGETETAINKELQKVTGSPFIQPAAYQPDGGNIPEPPSELAPPSRGIPARCQWIQDDLDQTKRDAEANRDYNGKPIDKSLGIRLASRHSKLEKDLAYCIWNKD